MKHCILTFFFCLVAQSVFCAPTITLVATDGNCPADGLITVTADGTTGSVFYAIQKEAGAYSTQQASNVFNNLTSGTYTVAVYDASGTTISDPVTLTNKAYTTISVNNKTTGNAVITACDPDGSINLTIVGGNAPFTYHLKGGPTVKPDEVSLLRSVQFTQLNTGAYLMDITDACGSTITVSGLAVTSLYNLNGITLGSLAGMGNPTVNSVGCDAAINFSTSNITLKDDNNNVLFQRDVKHMPTGYPIEIRVEYPTGSGIYTPWQNVFSSFNLTNYRPDQNTYQVEMRHPCNLTNVVTSPVYYTPPPFLIKSGFCAPTIAKGVGFSEFNCGTVHIALDKITGSGAQSASYDWDGTGPFYEPNLTGLSGTYAVYITVGGNTYRTATINSDGMGTTTTNMEVGALQSVTVAANTFDYPSTADCDFTTGNIRSFISGGFPPGNTVPITYSIVSGPELRDSVTSTDALTPIWAKLQPGTYRVRIDYGGCRTEERNITVAPPYSGFSSQPSTYITGTSCGKYKITGRGWYVRTADSTVVTTGVNYIVRILKADGTAVPGVVSNNDRHTVVSNAQFTVPYEVGPGTYKVIFASGFGSGYKCNYVEEFITIPPYSPVIVDVPNSGGLICGAEIEGILHVATTGGSGLEFTYRFKPQGSADANYSVYQSSPDFPGLVGGNYTVQVQDACGYITTQDLTMSQSNSSSFFRATGANLIDRVVYACPGSAVQLNLTVIGTFSNIEWTKPNGDKVQGDSCALTNVSDPDFGTYLATYQAGGCSWENSVELREAPERTTWQGIDTDWNNLANWDNGVPWACTYVVIAKGKSFYPILTLAQNAVCDSIEFEFGGEVARTDLLTYNGAKLDLVLKANRWNMIAPPLQGMFPGDYYKTSPNPVTDNLFVYTQLYAHQNPQTQDPNYPSGDWSGTFNTPNVTMPSGFGFAAWLDDHTSAENNILMAFPKHDQEHHYYNYSGAIIGTVPLTRVNENRFVYEPVLSGGEVTLTSSAAGGETAIVGNPFMSHWNFADFVAHNGGKILHEYKLLLGSDQGAFTTYTPANPFGLDSLIAPMQSIIVTASSSGFTSLSTPTSSSQTNPGTTLRSDDTGFDYAATLIISASRGSQQNKAAVIFNPDIYDNRFHLGEDSYKLFVEGVTAPVVVYTLASDGRALDINSFGDLSQAIPIGIRTSEIGNIQLQFSGLENFLIGYSVSLHDNLTDQFIDLKNTQEYSFEKTNTDLYLNDRFQLVFKKKVVTGFDAVSDASSISVGSVAGMLQVICSDGSMIQKIEVFDLQGRTLLTDQNVNQQFYNHALNAGQVCIVKVTTAKNSVVKKIYLK